MFGDFLTCAIKMAEVSERGYCISIFVIRSGVVVVKASASPAVDLGLIPMLSHTEHFKNCVHRFPAKRSA